MPTFFLGGGVVSFLKLFYFLALYSIFGYFKGSFWVWFLSFENFENGFGFIMPTFEGFCFHNFSIFLLIIAFLGLHQICPPNGDSNHLHLVQKKSPSLALGTNKIYFGPVLCGKLGSCYS